MKYEVNNLKYSNTNEDLVNHDLSLIANLTILKRIKMR